MGLLLFTSASFFTAGVCSFLLGLVYESWEEDDWPIIGRISFTLVVLGTVGGIIWVYFFAIQTILMRIL
jgi:hypothetical protein